MSNKISTFAELPEPERMLFVARLHHALWYSEDVYVKIKIALERIEKGLPEAKYFPPHPSTEL